MSPKAGSISSIPVLELGTDDESPSLLTQQNKSTPISLPLDETFAANTDSENLPPVEEFNLLEADNRDTGVPTVLCHSDERCFLSLKRHSTNSTLQQTSFTNQSRCTIYHTLSANGRSENDGFRTPTESTEYVRVPTWEKEQLENTTRASLDQEVPVGTSTCIDTCHPLTSSPASMFESLDASIPTASPTTSSEPGSTSLSRELFSPEQQCSAPNGHASATPGSPHPSSVDGVLEFQSHHNRPAMSIQDASPCVNERVTANDAFYAANSSNCNLRGRRGKRSSPTTESDSSASRKPESTPAEHVRQVHKQLPSNSAIRRSQRAGGVPNFEDVKNRIVANFKAHGISTDGLHQARQADPLNPLTIGVNPATTSRVLLTKSKVNELNQLAESIIQKLPTKRNFAREKKDVDAMVNILGNFAALPPDKVDCAPVGSQMGWKIVTLHQDRMWQTSRMKSSFHKFMTLSAVAVGCYVEQLKVRILSSRKDFLADIVQTDDALDFLRREAGLTDEYTADKLGMSIRIHYVLSRAGPGWDGKQLPLTMYLREYPSVC